MPGPGGHLLRVSFDVSGDWLKGLEVAQTLITGDVWCNNSPASPWVGALVPRVLTLRPLSTSSWLAVQVYDDQLLALEKARSDQSLDLRIDIQSTLLHPSEGFYPVAEDQVTASIGSFDWARVLDRVGLQTGLLIRVAGPFVDSNAQVALADSMEDLPSLAQAVSRLRQARAQLGEGRWEQCIATCRRVLENLKRIGPPLPTAKSIRTQADPEKLNEAERWAALYYATAALTQPAHHDDTVTLGFSFSREKAEAVLAATAGLLNVYTSVGAPQRE
ncbi:hypothetical protein Aau02nite_70690 [Amorphoplanes auranticolor]|uniref:Uncharacterized protein n=2 Tax=Actinoplanes auranticolor TaxID=47988 RepID=A0A919SST8_9ACTN|nr:hypothetical protein Aau02nite_70690 [Actinoplanes auranticolor]